jgi:hypothetical protein
MAVRGSRSNFHGDYQFRERRTAGPLLPLVAADTDEGLQLVDGASFLLLVDNDTTLELQ